MHSRDLDRLLAALPTDAELVRAICAQTAGLLEDSDGTLDLRLQVYDNGSWRLHHGDPWYATDHHGYWAATVLTADGVEQAADDLLSEITNALYEDLDL